ncbi:MAG: DUF4440 domain-containing protein [Candidatus Eremiobacteraeota bacterium]|nr:DUF4440 domain-containing protein [Candidatus Eremiobacteraeota bacterium]
MRFTRLLFSGLALLVVTATAVPARSNGDVAALIKRQSQEFSDASATGNAAVLARYLDDNVTFMDEDGDVGTKKDLLAGTTPTPKDASHVLHQTDWHIQLYGKVAVTAFTDESSARFHGQTLKAKFRSTEVWIEKTDGWKMISSQTIALQVDPPAITLPTGVLSEYVGTYTAGGGFDVAIAQSGDALTASVNGSKPVGLKAEVKDVFFIPGQPRLRRIFRRDAGGAIIGFVSRREGHDVAFKRVT